MKFLRLAALVLGASRLIGSDVTTRPDDFSLLEISGTCMTPLLRDGQLVLVDTAVKFDALGVGDVITFRFRGRQYAHRIVGVRHAGTGERYLITKGDNVCSRETVTAADYLGRISP